MTEKMLITQCLQNDFVRPIGHYDALPNLLHIGFSEALRLMGENPADGPVSQMMDWAYAQKESDLAIVNIRDWHDGSVESQKKHLEFFGAHCLQNSPGADFAFKPRTNRATNVVNALTLNDFIDSNLAAVLEPYREREMDVGLIGVWTEAKITFLAYELTTRYPKLNLAICSALTASSSRAQHFIALDHLRKVLGVKVYESVGEFIEFLDLQGSTRQTTRLKASDSVVLKIGFRQTIEPQTESLLRYLFRDCKSVELKTLDGGFSGNLVLSSESVDSYGHAQVPHVVKIGPRALIASERTAFERIESVLGNNAPRIVEFADLENLGAIKYRYASMGGKARSFQKIYGSDEKLSHVKAILTDVFQNQLGRLYAASELEAHNLFEHYGFRADLTERVYKMALGADATNEEAQLLSRFYSDHVPQLLKNQEYRYFAYVHGDLNGANIIIDAHQNVWLIDFFHTQRGHILQDLVKLENDLLFIYTHLNSKADLNHAVAFSEQLLAVDDLWHAPTFRTAELEHPQFRRAADVIRHLRSFYRQLIQADRDVSQLMIAQLRYAVHTLSFDESSALQKRWALSTALMLINRLVENVQANRNLRIDWINATGLMNQIGLTILPGRRDRQRDLAQDLEVLKTSGVSDVVCLATNQELRHYGVHNLLQDYKDHGLQVHTLQIPDGKAPLARELNPLLTDIEERLQNGAKLVLHCVGGLGRSGLVAACLLKRRGLSSDEAIETVRRQRSQRAIETSTQEKFVKRFRGPLTENGRKR